MSRIRLARRRPRSPLRVAPLALAAALWLGGGATAPSRAASGPADDLDHLVQSTLDGVPAENANEVVEWIVDAFEGSTGYHAFSPAAFFQGGQPTMALNLDTSAGSLRLEGLIDACLYAPLHLPQGATITGLVFWVRDNNSVDNATAAVHRARIEFSSIGDIAEVTSSGSAGGSRIFADFSISNGVVDNSLYWYFAYVCLPRFGSPNGPTEMRGLYLSYSF